MLRQSAVLHKKPVVFKYGNSSFTNQLKNMLQKKTPHRSEWGSLEQYEPRALAHVNKKVDHYSYTYKYDPHYAPTPKAAYKDIELIKQGGSYRENQLEFRPMSLEDSYERLEESKNTSVYYVPDQVYNRIPVPGEFKDAYWHRETKAQRVQQPLDNVRKLLGAKNAKNLFDFQDLAVRPKFQFTDADVLDHMKNDLE
jgi:hypothetical protein